jgi:hypothetical protein
MDRVQIWKEVVCVYVFVCKVVRVGDRVTELLVLAFVCARVNGRPVVEKWLGYPNVKKKNDRPIIEKWLGFQM